MKSTLTSVVFSAGLILALAGCASGVDTSAEEARGTAPTIDQEQQQHIASTTLALEKAYDVQFVKGQVDPGALQPLIYDVLQSMPEGAREKAKAHIYDVISKGQKDASEMTAEQRAQLAAPVSTDKLGAQQIDIIGAWGWGFPAFGAVGFPGVGFGGLGWGGAWGTSAAFTSTTAFGTAGFGFPGFGAVGWGAGWVPGWGVAGWTPALGVGWGLGFGGLGAFGFPGCFGGAWGLGGLGLGAGLGLGVGVPGGWGF